MPEAVAITGGGGYVGSRLALALAARAPTRVLVRQHEPLPRGVEQITGDLLSSTSVLDTLCEGARTLVHLAGPNEVASAQDPEAAVVEVAQGTLRLADAAQRQGVHRAIYVSTVHVYGARLLPGVAVTEEMPCEPRSAYAIARLTAEHLLASAGPPDLITLRLTNSIGAPAWPAVDRWSLVANDLCRQGVTEGVLRLRTSGTQWRDFVSLTEVCRVIGECAQSGAVAPGTYNLGSGVPMTIRDLAIAIQDAFVEAGAAPPPLEAPDPEADPPGPYRVSVEKLAASGIRVQPSVSAAILETVRFCLEHRDDLSSPSNQETRP